MQTLVFPCRKCGAPLEAGAKAALAATMHVLLDCACPACGHRALYPTGPRGKGR